MFINALLVFLALGAVNGDRRDEVIKFMEKNNFLARCRLDGKSVDDCIMDVKRYCGIQHVGNAELTDELMGCVRRTTCGLPMVPSVTRSKFFSLEKFDKTEIKWVLLNKGTNNILSKEETEKMVYMAFEVWKCYTPLQFVPVHDIKYADIIISFTPRVHSYHHYITKELIPSSYPFDGPGGVLAHAFYPIKNAGPKGNFHYDDDETWIENHKNGIKLLHTTVHELGHNLGLPHTNEYGNIMFGMYDDSYHETELDLGPYDKSQIQQRYGARQCTRKIWQEYYRRKYPDGAPKEGDGNKPDEGNKEVTCTDLVDVCEKYDKRMCTHDTHREWMTRNCAKYCGFCTAYSTVRNSAKDEVCAASHIDGAFKSNSGDLYLIVNGTLFKREAFTKRLLSQFKKKIANLWDRRLSRPTATAYKRATDTLYLFQGQELFVVKGFSSGNVRTKVLKLPGIVSNPVAAFTGVYKGREVINVYKNHNITALTIGQYGIKLLKTQPFKSIFDAGKYQNRIPPTVDSAYDDGDRVLFLTGSSVTIAHRDGERYSLSSGMKPFMTHYLRCPQVQ